MVATRKVIGWLMLLAALAVFAMRLRHAGPYYFPEGGNLLAALLALLIGAWLTRNWIASSRLVTGLHWLALCASPAVFFFALYAILAELEEVVVMHAQDRAGQPAQLRLWVVDHDGASWVTMPRSKADEHGLDSVRIELLRRGSIQCMTAIRFEDHEAVNKVHQLRHEKYRVQRLATSIGLFGREVGANTVTLRLEPC